MKTRILSAIVMCAIVVPILIIGGIYFKIFVTALGVASIYELLNIRKNKKEIPLFIRILSYIATVVFIWFGTSLYAINHEFIYKVIAAMFLLYFIPIIIIDDDKKYNVTDAFYALGSTIFIAVAFNSCSIIVTDKDMLYLVYIMLVPILTDTFAYFTGYYIGKHKLCEKISPKKTWEGAIGGTLVATGVASAFYLVVLNPEINAFIIIGITLLLSVVGQFGDLFFSSIKRHFNVKDYSNLIPGHGGILDRLDSIIFVILTYVLFVNML